MEEKYLHKMYDELFYRAAALACHEADSAEIMRDAALPDFQPYSQKRYEEGLCALKEKCRAAEKARAAAAVPAPPEKQKRMSFRRPLRVLIAAAMVMCLLVTSAVATGGVLDRVRIADHGEYSAIKVDSGALMERPASWQAACYPLWVPAGFTLNHVVENEMKSGLSYKNNSGDCLTFQIIPPEQNLSSTALNTINTENSDEVQVFIHGNPATVYVRRDFYFAMCYFSYEGTGYIIGGNVTADDIVHMAEQLSIFER